MRIRVFSVLLVLFALSFSAFGMSVTAIGVGPTRQAAINNAIRNAIEQALGSYVKSHSEVSMGKLTIDRIISSSSGYVRNYQVIAEGMDPVESVYKVRLRVELDDYKLKNVLDEFLKDARFQKAFQKTTFDQRRVIVLYNRRTPHDLPYNSMAVQRVMDDVQDRLAGYGFRVFLPEHLRRIKMKVTDLAIDEETAINIARQEDGDAVVVVSIDAGKRPTPDGFWIIYANVSLKAYDVTTGELFANVFRPSKTIARGGSYGLADGAARACQKVSGRAADELVKKIVERFSTKREKFVVMIFRDVPIDVQDKIEDILDNLGWQYRIARQSGTYMEVEVFSEADPTSVRRAFRRAYKSAGLYLIPVEAKGSRLVYSGQ